MNMFRNRVYAFFLSICLVILACVGAKSDICLAAEPKVMLTDYEINPDKVNAGDTFTLTIHLMNTATKKVKNMKVTLISEDGSVLPASGAGTAYVKEIAGETEEELSFDMRAIPGLAEKSYKLTVKTEYEDVNGSPYTVEDSVYVPVSLESRISVTEIMTLDDVKIGDDAEIYAVVNNLGKGTIYNVTAVLEGKSVEPKSVYVGNIEPGKSGNVDVLTKAVAVTTSGPEAKNTLTITYEDAQGEKYQEVKDVSVYVKSSSYENLTVLKEGKKSDINKTVILLVVVAVLLVAFLVVKILKLRKKKKLLEDF